MRTGVPIARIAGIRIRAHWSVLLIAGLLAWGLAEGLIPMADSSAGVAVRWGLGALGAGVLLISLTAHELAHSMVARRNGATVADITLWLFGGVSHIQDDWTTPGTEFKVAVAGPLVTLVAALLFLGVAFGLDRAGAPVLAVLVAQWLFGVNVLLLLFNLLPAFPLDGGRILRAVIWRVRNDRQGATRLAAGVGRAFAFVLMALGLAWFFLTGDFSGAWLIFIGWYLDNTARREQQGESVRALLHGVRVGEAMSNNPVRVPSWITVDLLLEQYVVRSNLTTFVTHGIDGRIEGLVTLRAIRLVSPRERGSKRASDIAVPLPAVPTATPSDLLTDLLSRMSMRTEGRALVFDAGELVGVVSPSDVARVMSRLRPTGPGRQLPPPPPLPPAPEANAPRF